MFFSVLSFSFISTKSAKAIDRETMIVATAHMHETKDAAQPAPAIPTLPIDAFYKSWKLDTSKSSKDCDKDLDGYSLDNHVNANFQFSTTWPNGNSGGPVIAVPLGEDDGYGDGIHRKASLSGNQLSRILIKKGLVLKHEIKKNTGLRAFDWSG